MNGSGVLHHELDRDRGLSMLVTVVECSDIGDPNMLNATGKCDSHRTLKSCLNLTAWKRCFPSKMRSSSLELWVCRRWSGESDSTDHSSGQTKSDCVASIEDIGHLQLTESENPWY